MHRACQEQLPIINNCEEDGTAPGSFCQGCFSFRAKEFTSTRISGTNESKTNDVDKLNENSIEENKNHEEEVRVVGTVNELATTET